LSILETLQTLLNAPDVFFLSLTLPGKDGNTGGSDSSGSIILSREDIARRPSDLSTKSNKGLNQTTLTNVRN